ncbi:MAG TPA: nucleotidyltransferase domain-containing protein [bacterium]|nr:nucleotidyltransferase domain-containing protein [bacterium]
MENFIQNRLAKIRELCARHDVMRLAVFGSSIRDGFKPGTSDVDLLVEFQPLPPSQYSRNYFALLEDLEKLFGTAVDLVETEPITNPFFKREIERTKMVLYEAA